MLGKLFRRGNKYAPLTSISHPVYGRLDGDDAPGFLFPFDDERMTNEAAEDLSAVDGSPITNDEIIQCLEAQLQSVLAQLTEAQLIVEAARQFCNTVAAKNHKTGEAVFSVVDFNDQVAAMALASRYAELASLLNGFGRPGVPPRLHTGVVH